MRKVILEVNDEMYKWVMGFVAMCEHATGESINILVKEVGDTSETELRDRSTVRYAAIGDRSALAALGEKTIIGIIFAHLLDNGPKTAKEIGREKPFNMKTLVASLWRLRQQGLIESQVIE